jgi:hypothetical protein
MGHAAVSDGHGGDDYFRSHIGSRFAVEKRHEIGKGLPWGEEDTA